MPVEVRVGIEVALAGAAPGRHAAHALVRRAAGAALAAEGVDEAELSFTLLDDAAIADLNERWLRHEGPTDVISFELHPPGAPPVGDVYIGWHQLLRQAEAHGVPVEEELARLVIHGTLHVLGHEHPEGDERETSAMWRRQESIVREVVGT